TAAGRRLAGVAACGRCAVERSVELVLVHREPGAERLARAAAPGPALLAFDDAGRLTVEVRPLSCAALQDGARFEAVTGEDARAAAGVVPLERGDRAIPLRHERTTTNHSPSRSTSPPPSSSTSCPGRKKRLKTGHTVPSLIPRCCHSSGS